MKKLLLICVLINVVASAFAWFGGDIIMHNGAMYLKDSFEAMRCGLAFTSLINCMGFLALIDARAKL